MITLGRFRYPDTAVILAPMAGISDLPYRRICQNLGSHYTVAEMISARPELMAEEQTQIRLQFDDNPDFPKIVQLAGGDPALMAEAAQLMQAKGADVIDINMGCPAKKVGKQNAGSALLSDLPMAEKILQKTAAAVSIPVTLKTRIGFTDNDISIETVGKMAENAGIAAIAVHGRTRAQRFQGSARFAEIGALKNRLNIPVIANGDIKTPEQAKTLINRYGFDGLMIGRAAQGNPWLLAAIRQALNPDWKMPETPDKNALIEHHIRALHALYPAPHNILCARKHLHWYYREHPNYAAFRDAVNQAQTAASQLAALNLVAA